MMSARVRRLELFEASFSPENVRTFREMLSQAGSGQFKHWRFWHLHESADEVYGI
jgi:hypothetical protein